MALEPGARLGPYEIVSPAGAGGMGEVYRALDTRLDRTVAIKVLPPNLTSDPPARQRFEREARAVAALSHPHICTLHDIGQQDGTDFLVMEYLDGETLAQRLTRGMLPLEQAVQYGTEIVDALAAAHKAGIVHRDLKPGNVMLTKSGAKLLDFGLAKSGVQLVGPGVTQLTTEGPLTSAGTLLGTLPYMAPEQLQAYPVDARADVFAFGCVLYEMLIGGSRLRRMSVAGGHLADIYLPDPEILDQTWPSFLPDGRRFLYAQFSKNPARRGVFLGALDSPQVSRLMPEPANAVVTTRGYLLFGRQGTLFAQRFELESNRLAGEPVSIGSGLGFVGSFTYFDVGGDILVWANDSGTPPARLTWFDRNGRKLNEIGEVRRYAQIAIAPDGRNVAATEEEPGISFSVFLIELTRNIHTRLTTGGHYDPVWSPDSREVAFVSEEGLSKRRIDQRAETTLLHSAVVGVEDWTHDGRFVIFSPGPRNISALPLGGDRKPIPVIESSSSVDEPRVSRDGRWLAYSANETGQWEVYVQPFMRPGDRVRVSTSGGTQAHWRADGKELFYLTLNGMMMSVDTSDPTSPAAPRRRFESRVWVNPVTDQFDVTPDGQRFLLAIPEGQQATRLTVLTNWASVLTGR